MKKKSLIFSSYTNAYAIYKGVQSLGVDAATTDSDATFPMPSQMAATKADWLFFTEEASLRRALTGELTGNYLPRQFPLHLLDDKWALVQWLDGMDGLAKGLRQWSLAERNQVTYPCLLKAKHSWAESVKLPRGWVCHSAQELEHRLISLKTEGLNPAHFFLQEWLGDFQCRVISVCGFHDSKNSSRNLVAVVERVAAHTDGLSCSAAVQTIDDQWQLISKTAAILNALDFTGPYEMECLVVGQRALVLELNPRFWMQHAIFLKVGNGLIKRYLGIDTEDDKKNADIKNVVWIDGLHFIMSIFRFRIDFLSFVMKKLIKKDQKIILWPSLLVAIRVTGRMVLKKYKTSLFGGRLGI